MKYRTLGPDKKSISEIGLGCASYWGQRYFSHSKAAAVVAAALDSGINYIDTGSSYSNGHAEIRLGKVLKQHASHSLILSSKAGTEVGHFGRLYKDFSPQALRHSCERSLKRLGVDSLSIFFLHGPNTEDFNEDTYQTLQQLKASGKIQLAGVNTFSDEMISRTRESDQFDILMTDFNVFKPERIALLSDIKETGLEVIVAGALGGALYSRNWRRFAGLKSLWYWLRAYKNHRIQMTVAEKFDFLNDHPNLSAVQTALAYVLNQDNFSSALVGSTSASHLHELADVSGKDLTQPWLERIERINI